MSIQENKAVVLRFINEVQNQKRLDVLDEVADQGFVDYSGTMKEPGLEALKAIHRMLFAAFPDLRVTIRMQLAEGDKVLTYKTFHGTHLGPFKGIPPTGKEITFDIMDIMTIRDGKMTEHWKVEDAFGLMQQLGAMPEPMVG